MKNKLIILLFILTSGIAAQTQFQSFLAKVNSTPSIEAKTALVDSFITYARTKGIPFIEDSIAVFLYRGVSNPTQLAGDFTGWNTVNMINIQSTDLFYSIIKFEMDARLDYKFVLSSGYWILDPENPKRCPGGYGPNSELAMPSYVQPWEIAYRPNIKHGKLEYKSFKSIYTNKTYQCRIYLPPDYDSSKAVKYPTVYFQDGSDYINLASATNVIDNLLDSNKIEPFISVFVPPTNRNEEYAYSLRNSYMSFFVKELVPFIDSLYNTEMDPNRRLVLGDSFGGNISALISYNYPDVFANCGQHSGAFWPNNYEASNMLKNGPHKNIKIFSVWGSYYDVEDDWRILKDSLISKGYDFKWHEKPEGHSWGLWRATLDDMLTYFFPATQTDVKENIATKPTRFFLSQNYPNPFNPTTKIKFTLAAVETSYMTSLRIYNVLGKEIITLINKELSAGTYEVDFTGQNLSSGVYFYQLKIGNSTVTKKMCLIK